MKLTPFYIKNILVPHAGTLAGNKASSDAIHIAKITRATINILRTIESFLDPNLSRKTLEELKCPVLIVEP